METQKNRKLLAVVFTDIEGFSALTQKNEAKALQFVSRYRESIKQQTESYNGKVIHFYGDGSLTTHESTYDAVMCAIAIQEELRLNPMIPVRIGIHFGEVVITDETIYGNAVNIAARLHNLGSPQSILISGTVAAEMHNHTDLSTVYITRQSVKNIKEPVDIHAIVKAGLVVPSKQDLNRRSKVRRQKINIASTIIGLILIAMIAYFNWPTDAKERRVLVYPFTNATGDTSLNHLSTLYSGYVTQLLSDFEDVKLVYAPDLMMDERMEFGFIDYPALRSRYQARNIIEGEFVYDSDSTLLLSCGLIDGDNKEYLKQFEPQVIRISDYTDGLVALTERIIGFIKSEKHNFVSPPNQDAFSSFFEAQRVWAADDGKEAEKYIRNAIRYDSSFADAYFLLADIYHNRANPVRADSVLEVIKDRFRIETMTEAGKNHVYYYEALYAGHNAEALSYGLMEYERDKEELFRNTTVAKVALYYANAPEVAIRVLNKIKWRGLDYNNTWNASRLTTGIEAYTRLGKYKKALKLAEYYPPNMVGRYERKQLIRLYVAVQDTSALTHTLREIELSGSESAYRSALFWTYQQCLVFGLDDLAELYRDKTYNLVTSEEYTGTSRITLEYTLGNTDDAQSIAKARHKKHPGYRPYIPLVAQGFDPVTEQDSVEFYRNQLLDLKSTDPYRGRTSYLEACLYTYHGDHQAALIKLQTAVNEGFEFKDYSGQFDPRLMPLFDEPEFDQIIHPYGK